MAASDANPYLAIAAVLGAGYLGMISALKPEPPVDTDANLRGVELPRSLIESVELLSSCAPLRDVLGGSFIDAYSRVKLAEYDAFMRTVSPWEREFLLLNV